MSSRNNPFAKSTRQPDDLGRTGSHGNLILSEPFTDYETLPRKGGRTLNRSGGKPTGGQSHASTAGPAANPGSSQTAGQAGSTARGATSASTAGRAGRYGSGTGQHIKDAIYSNVDTDPLQRRQSLRRAVLRDPKSNGFHMLGLVDDKNPFINLARRYAEQTRKGDRVTESVFSLEKLKQRNLLGMTPLEWALRHGTPRTAEGFIRLIAAFHDPANLELKEENLFRLARRNSPEMVEVLIRLRHLLGLYDQNFENVFSEPRAILSDPLVDEVYAA